MFPVDIFFKINKRLSWTPYNDSIVRQSPTSYSKLRIDEVVLEIMEGDGYPCHDEDDV